MAEILSVDRTTTARAIQKIEKDSLIEKKNDQENKKIKHLFVTDKGEKLAQRIEQENAYSNELALAGLDPAQRKELIDLLKTVEKNVTANWHFVKNGEKRKY